MMAAFEKAPPASVDAILDGWEATGPKALKTAVQTARKAS